MKIGIVSDSHGKSKRLARAIGLVRDRGAQAILHCGDMGSDDCVKLLGNAGIPAYAVAGNSDRHPGHLELIAAEAGVTFSTETVEIPIGPDQYVIATHGHDEGLLGTLIAGGQFPYVCHGHSHQIQDEKIGPTRVIDPGALTRPRGHGHKRTCALLDTETDTVEFIEVPR